MALAPKATTDKPRYMWGEQVVVYVDYADPLGTAVVTVLTTTTSPDTGEVANASVQYQVGDPHVPVHDVDAVDNWGGTYVEQSNAAGLATHVGAAPADPPVPVQPLPPDVGSPPYPDQGLPGNQPGIDNTLPGQQPGIDNTLPGNQPGIDNTLPGQPPRPDQGLPPVSPPAIDNTLPGNQPGIDNTLPGAQPGIDNTLPGAQPRPDQGLPGDPPYLDQTLPGLLPQPKAARLRAVQPGRSAFRRNR